MIDEKSFNKGLCSQAKIILTIIDVMEKNKKMYPRATDDEKTVHIIKGICEGLLKGENRE